MQVGKTARGLLAGIAAAALLLPTSAAIAAPTNNDLGIHVEDGRLYEEDGTELVLRGVNHAHTWYAGQTSAFANIGTTGANSIRTVLSNGVKWTKNDLTDVKNVIEKGKNAGLINILEVHDTTGYGDTYADLPRSTLDQAADYWIEIKDALIGQEDYVMVNLGNEPYGNDATVNASYVAQTKAAIAKLRAAGIKNTIVVDAPAWGQDWQYLMRDNAQDIYSADPSGNTVFSIHMYQVFSTASSVTNYLEYFLDRDLPIIVGEFGDAHQGEVVAFDAILSESERLNVGWLAWSWSGNSDPYLDMVSVSDWKTLSAYGEKVLNGPNGIAETSTRAAVFGDIVVEPEEPGPGNPEIPTCTENAIDPDGDGWGWENDASCKVDPNIPVGGGTTEPTDPPTTTTPTDPPTTSEPGATCAASYSKLGDWGTGFQGAIEVKASQPISSWKITFTLNGATVSSLWGGQLSGSGTYTVSNEAWNGSLAAGQTASIGFIGNGAGPASVSVSCE